MILLYALACTPDVDDPPEDTDAEAAVGDDTAPSGDTGDTWLALDEGCSPTSDPGVDPLEVLAEYRHGPDNDGLSVEFVDLVRDGELLYGVGQGGVLTYDMSDPADPVFLSVFTSNHWAPHRYHRMELLDDGLVALTHREHGLVIADFSDPAKPYERGYVERVGAEGLAWHRGRLLVAVRGEGIAVYDVDDPGLPVEVEVVEGLSAPWEISAFVDDWAYVSDNTLGLVPVHFGESGVELHDAVDLGAVLHAAQTDSGLYVALGGSGLAVLDTTDPASPTTLASLTTGSSVVHVAEADDILWAADHEGAWAFDVTDRSAPQVIGREVTYEQSLAVAGGTSSLGWLGDWTNMKSLGVADVRGGPVLDLSADTVTVPEGGGSTVLELRNRGGSDLVLGGAEPRADLTLEVTRTTIPAGESGQLRVTWGGEEDPSEGFCLGSNDPNAPELVLEAVVGDGSAGVGATAPDFVLDDTDGNSWRLSEQLGSPVMLAWFATW